MIVILCPVRGCGDALERSPQQLTCGRSHSFDVAKRGYVNLLQPQDRKSKMPGDSVASIEARRRLFAAGLGDPLAAAIDIALPRFADPTRVLDIGCGIGFHLRTLAAGRTMEACGVDISSRAIDLAAREMPSALWLVVNADRGLPFAEASFDVALSIDARLPALAMASVVRLGGTVIVSVPADDDLVELRETVLGSNVEKSRADRVVSLLEPEGFRIVRSVTITERRNLEAPILRDLLAATYRGARHVERARVDMLGAMDVTLSHDLLTFERIA